MKTGVEMLAVEQSDREAAADLIMSYWLHSGDDQMMALAQSYRDGHSQGVWAQAFARHRLATLEDGMRSYRLQQRAYLDEIDRLKAPTHPAATGSVREALRAIEQHINDFAGCDDSPSGDEVESDARKGLAFIRQHIAAAPTPDAAASDAAVPAGGRWTIEGVMAEMLAVAVASIEAEEGDQILEDWPLDCRADVDRWQSVISRALAAAPKVASVTDAAASEAGEVDTERLDKLIDKIDAQAKCLEGYAEQDGHSGKAPASVYHWQATHFRDIAAELRREVAALTTQGGAEG